MDIPIMIYAALIVAAAVFLASVVRTYGENPNPPVGRFQFHEGPNGACRVLNTKTGAMWERQAGSGEWIHLNVPWVGGKSGGRK
jgi:hypothetical protein